MEEKILDILDGYLTDNVSADDELLDSKILSSYDLVELICELETLCDIKFTRDDIQNMENWSTINNIINLIKSKNE